MTVSGSTDYAPTSSVIIRDALHLIGALDLSVDTPQTKDQTFALRMLNRMLKGWQLKGEPLTLEKEGSITLVASTAEYALTPRALSVREPFIRSSSDVDTPLDMMTRSDYRAYPTKSSTGRPHSIYFQRARDTSSVFVVPPPASAGETIYFSYQEVIDDIDATTDSPDLPQQAMDMLVYNLADRLLGTPNYALDARSAEKIADKAAEMRADFLAWDQTDDLAFVVEN